MKQNKCLLVGLISLMFSINSLYAQKDSLNVSTNNESYKRVYILDVGLGIGFTGIQKNGSSSWYIGNRFENGREEVVDLLLSPVVVALPEGNIERGLSLGLGDDSAKLVVGSREELPGREVVVVDESAVRHGAVRN